MDINDTTKSTKYYSIEPFFDGIRKNNARKVFGILLIIIVADFVIDIISGSR